MGDHGRVCTSSWPIVTHPRIFRTPTPIDFALAQIDAWLESPTLVLLAENDEYADAFREVVLASHVTGPRIHDARVAALCLSHGIREIWTADRDFSVFPQFMPHNPLIG